EDLPQCRVKQMRAGVVGLRAPASPFRDLHVDQSSVAKCAGVHRDTVGDRARQRLLRVRDGGFSSRPSPGSGVRDLTAPFGIEDRAIRDDLPRLSGRELARAIVVLQDAEDLGPGEPHEVELRVAAKFGMLLRKLELLEDRGVGRFELGRSTRTRALLLHRGLETLAVDREPLVARDLLDDVDRYAVRVVKAKERFARNRPRSRSPQFLDLLARQVDAGRKSTSESLLFRTK